jgi:hypothetical protein
MIAKDLIPGMDRNWTPGSNGAEDPVAARWSGVGAEDEVAVHAAEPV